MKIGLLSDTHNYLDPKVYDFFKDCDEIWHAGDIGEKGLITELEKCRPIRAVYGKNDSQELQHILPEDLWFTCQGITFWMTHIGGVPPNYNPRIKMILKNKTPDVFICGHSHILRIKHDLNHNNLLYINPGAAGNQGFHTIKTIVRFEINNGKIEKMEVIELGKRGAIL